MRPKRPQSSWLGRLFSFKGGGQGKPDADRKPESFDETKAATKTSARRLTPAEVLALAKSLDPAKTLPARQTPASEAAPAPASAPEPPKAKVTAKAEAPAKPEASPKTEMPLQSEAPAKEKARAPKKEEAPKSQPRAKDQENSKSAERQPEATPFEPSAAPKTSKPVSLSKSKSRSESKPSESPAPQPKPSESFTPSPSSPSQPLSDSASSTAKPDAKPGDEVAAPGEQRFPPWLVAYWRKMGGGSLVASLALHLVLLIIASLVVSSVVSEPTVDFLPGGGSKAGEAASNELAQRVQSRKMRPLTKAPPLQRIVTNNASAIPLPDLPIDTIPMPEMSSALGGTMSSGGFGSSGSGGGFGDGMGMGGMSGRAFKPITMFGKNLNARSIAVILDVSGSMTPHLSKVIAELDRVAKGSPVILYVGCGVAKPSGGRRLDDDTTDTRRLAAFKPFWEAHHGPEQEVFGIMSKRPYTYFIKDQGIQYAWISLLTDEVRRAEALYWFSDFQDQVDDTQMESVLTNLKRRKQKLFIHASDVGASFEAVRDKICLPSGGAVIQAGG